MTSIADEKPKIPVALRSVAVTHPWEAFLLPVSGFPVPEEEIAPVRALVQKLATTVHEEWKVSSQVFIQHEHLRVKARIFSSHGREWMPAIGLGVWPDRPAPTFWSREDFINLAPGEKPRTLMHQVFHITMASCANQARDTMLGAGTVVEILTCDDSSALLEKARKALLPSIEDPSYTCFPFYIPLLEAKSFQVTRAAQWESWFCGATVYIRESAEDRALLFVANRPLEAILAKIGGKLLTAPERFWHFS